MEAEEAIEHTSAISLDTVVYIFSLFTTGALLFLLVYFIITLSDLECDYLNAQECCARLNVWVLPKLIVHNILTIVLILSWHPYLALSSVPLGIYLTRQHLKIPLGNFGVYDPTEIHQRGQLKTLMYESLAGIGYYLVFFFIYMYCFLTHLLKHNPVPRPTYEDDTGL